MFKLLMLLVKLLTLRQGGFRPRKAGWRAWLLWARRRENQGLDPAFLAATMVPPAAPPGPASLSDLRGGCGPLNQCRLNSAMLKNQREMQAQWEGGHPLKSTEVSVT